MGPHRPGRSIPVEKVGFNTPHLREYTEMEGGSKRPKTSILGHFRVDQANGKGRRASSAWWGFRVIAAA